MTVGKLVDLLAVGFGVTNRNNDAQLPAGDVRLLIQRTSAKAERAR